MIKYKFDVLELLNAYGYNTTMLRQKKLLSESTIQDIRHGKMVGIKSLNTICQLLDMQPGNIIKYEE